MKWIACAAFGMEGMTGRDLKRMGMKDVRVLDVGGATFEGSYADAFRANLWLRTCDRIMRVMAQFEARTFEELFQGIRAVEWEKMLPEDARFPIRAKCVRSQLMSPSDVQKIGKRAMVERMKSAYGRDWFDETGALFQIDVSIRNDVVRTCSLRRRLGRGALPPRLPDVERRGAAARDAGRRAGAAKRLAPVAAAVRSLLRHRDDPDRGGVHRAEPRPGADPPLRDGAAGRSLRATTRRSNPSAARRG